MTPILLCISAVASKGYKALYVFLVVYLIPVKGFIDGQRLLEKGIIKRSEFWKAFIPLWMNFKYFRELYFEKWIADIVDYSL